MDTFVVTRRQAGRSLLEVLQAQLRLPRPEALLRLREKQVRVDGSVSTDGQRRLRPGERVQLVQPAAKKKRPAIELSAIARAIVVRHVDAHVVVVEKPPGLTTVRHASETAEFGDRGKRFLPPTLVDLLPRVLEAKAGKRPGRIRAVHRLDKETSGLVVLALTPAAESHLGKQFRAHSTGRRYLAQVRGRAKEQRIESWLVPDRGDGRRGSGPPGEGQHAVTHVRVVENLGDFTLVECELETGRTHQVRIHLGEAGTPLCGERVYDRPLHGKPLPDPSGAKRPMLHAAYLAFDHPATGKRMEWTAAMPEDMNELRKALSRKTG